MTWKTTVGAAIAVVAMWMVLAVPAGAHPVAATSGPAAAVPSTPSTAGQTAPGRDLGEQIGVMGA